MSGGSPIGGRARPPMLGLLLLASLIVSSPAGADIDIGNIAIIEADPTIRQPGEAFDLNGKTLTFTPRALGGYTVSAGDLTFDSRLGTNLGLPDDGSVSQALGFAFPFFGVSRASVFINSNGHLTFGAASSLLHFNGVSGGGVFTLGEASTVLDSMAEGLSRIAVLWQDWNPPAGGGVFANLLSDRLIVTWSNVPLFGTTMTATFQVVLFASGVIQMSYQSVTATPGGGFLVGLSPGIVSQFLVTTIDFSKGPASSASAFSNLEPLVQVFGSAATPLVHINAVARRFFQAHIDTFDQVIMFTGFGQAMGNALAFEFTTRQTVSGIGVGLFDISSFFGSQGRLQSFVNMNHLGIYPGTLSCLQDPACRFPGNNDSMLTLIGQETGHQWLAFVRFDDGGVCSDLLLGRDLAHWSFFHDTDASDMEGNRWMDHGDATFTTVEDTVRYSQLDQTIMGLRPAAEVAPFFFVDNPTGTTRTRSSAPQTGVTVSGKRKNVTVNQIVTCEGPRSPSSGFSGVNPTAVWKQAFILVIPEGTTAPQSDVAKIDAIRAAWVPYFSGATGGRGSVDTTLASSGPVLAAAVLPTERTAPVGGAAVTAFTTILNAGPVTALGCAIAPLTVVPATFTYQTTNAQNAVSGTPNTPADIPPGQGQSYVFAFTPTAAFPVTEIALSFACTNTAPAPSISGVNTFRLRATATPAPDPVALVATLNNDGILRLASVGAFAVATVNLGAPGLLTVSADTGAVSLPVSLALCQTNPTTGACLAPPTPSVQTQINSGATPTFGVFVSADTPIPFDPATNRIQVHIEGDGGGGGTSVAVCSQPLCP